MLNYHNVRDAKGRFVAATVERSKPAVPVTEPPPYIGDSELDKMAEDFEDELGKFITAATDAIVNLSGRINKLEAQVGMLQLSIAALSKQPLPSMPVYPPNYPQPISVGDYPPYTVVSSTTGTEAK